MDHRILRCGSEDQFWQKMSTYTLALFLFSISSQEEISVCYVVSGLSFLQKNTLRSIEKFIFSFAQEKVKWIGF